MAAAVSASDALPHHEAEAVQPAPRRTGGTLPSAPGEAHMGHIEVIRGLACLMVVAYHVVGNDPLHGLRVAADSSWGTVPRVLDAMQMPLFAFLSGRVFAVATTSGAAFRASWAKKAMRLGLPLLSVTLLLWITFRLTGKGEGKSLTTALLFPFEHLWFLQASLVLTAIAAIGSWVFRSRLPAFVAAATVVSLAVFLVVPRFEHNVFAIHQVIYLGPFFFFGWMMRMASPPASGPIENRWPPVVAVVPALVAVVAAAWTWDVLIHNPDAPSPYQNAPAFLFAMALALALMSLKPRCRFLEALGARSYTIYLFHVFFTSPTRQALWAHVPTASTTTVFVVSVIVGVGVPWLLHEAIVRNRIAAFLLLGIAPKAAAARSPS